MRRPRKKAFRLTGERKTLLEHLVRYRYLRTSHFYDLLGAGPEISDRAVRRQLRDFWTHGHLRRRVVVSDLTCEPLPRYEHVYWLSKAGVLLARDCGICDEEFSGAARTSPRALAHDVGITDFHLRVERFARARAVLLHCSSTA